MSSFKWYMSVSSGQKGGGERSPVCPRILDRYLKDEVNGFSSLTIFFMFTPTHTLQEPVFVNLQGAQESIPSPAGMTLFVVPARQATSVGGIDYSESIPGLHKRLQIRALVIRAQVFNDDITFYSPPVFVTTCYQDGLFLDKGHDLTFLEYTSAFTEVGSM